MAKRNEANSSLLTSVARTLGHAAGRLVRLTHEVTAEEKVLHPKAKAGITSTEQRSGTSSPRRPASAKSSTKTTTRRTKQEASSETSAHARKSAKKSPASTRHSKRAQKRKSKRSSI